MYFHILNHTSASKITKNLPGVFFLDFFFVDQPIGWHFLDDLNHHHLGHVEPSWSNFKAEERDEHWQIIRKTYEIIDRYLGKIIERMTERDYLIIISDHGNLPVSRQIWLEKFLQDKGFLVRKDNTLPLFTNDDNWSENIDWQKTKVYSSL